MNYPKATMVDSPIGVLRTDGEGSAIGVAHVDPGRSYSGINELLQRYINKADLDAWQEIKVKIDYTFESLDLALASLEQETGFGQEMASLIRQGRRLLFKPNLVNTIYIDPHFHGPGIGSTACTEWVFVAALMRWFHDKLDISYHQMALGEAATALAAAAAQFSMLHPEGKKVTTEAVIEGKDGDFYGGWGFYFVRQYLAESHDPAHTDDPREGYQESVSGIYIPPGLALHKLMVYDLNRIYDDTTKGRDVEVPDGANFQSITLHKAIVGGDPADPADRQAYPGCILVNVPKLKVHTHALFTNVIKNLGIGLYPMQVSADGHQQWKYGFPHTPVPGMKSPIPHEVWVPEMDLDAVLPKRDTAGHYIVHKTAGMSGTMVDIIKAVRQQGVFMFHVVDAIEAINLTNVGGVPNAKRDEGLVFAGLDPVATDLLCARYMFSNVSLKEASKVGLVDRAGGRFPQRVPLPAIEDGNIVTKTGYDCPLARDRSLEYAESRGLGQMKYYVVGRDAVSGRPLASLHGRLGVIADGRFDELTTDTLYYALAKMPWDMQKAFFAYLEAVDQLTGSSLKREFLEAFDDDGDEVVTYDDYGRKGVSTTGLYHGGIHISAMGTERFGFSHRTLVTSLTALRCSNPVWNAEGHDLFREYSYGAVFLMAKAMSEMPEESKDPFLPSLVWGKGKWPSFQLASYVRVGSMLYGAEFPNKIGALGLFGQSLRYADLTQNDGQCTRGPLGLPDMESASRYVAEVSAGRTTPLDFTLYVPPGYGSVSGARVPNVEETSDPAKVLTVRFGSGNGGISVPSP